MVDLPGAKLEEEVVGASRGAIRRVLGSALSSFGDMLDDHAKLWRFKNLLNIERKVVKLTEGRAVPNELFKALPFGDAFRTLEAASMEEEDDIQELWAGLITTASTKDDKPSVSKVHIDLLKSLTPADSALLDLLYPSVIGRVFKDGAEVAHFNKEMNEKAESRWRKFTEEERASSVQNLLRLRCITFVPKLIEAERLLLEVRDRRLVLPGSLVDPAKFVDLLNQIGVMIHQAGGAVPFDASSPVPLLQKNMFGGVSKFGELTVPELNHMLTPLGLQFMNAVTPEKLSVD